MAQRSEASTTIYRFASAMLGFSGALAIPAFARPTVMPAVFPTPVSIGLRNGTITLGSSVVLVNAPGTDRDTVKLVRRQLSLAGVEKISTVRRLPTVINRPYIVLGTANAAIMHDALSRTGAMADDHAEGYTIGSTASASGGIITLAGHDADGLFHAVQTFGQLVQNAAIPALVIRDHPAMPIRGTIEGFYGTPWSMADRIRHLDFLATVKANTYVYSPKDDPYARDRWREPYPTAVLTGLGDVVAAARRNHLDFIYAISPGPTICFADPGDARALKNKFATLRRLGITSFYVALDDVDYSKWNCELDKSTFGPPGAKAAGFAQAQLLNGVQTYLTKVTPNARALIMVPTEYFNVKESAYKAALRQYLDPRISVQWTGTSIVPPEISVPDAKAATKAFGRKTLLWDNYPVNDYRRATGRLMLAPYARREAGLSNELSGILSNPMNQEVPSRVAISGAAAFGWNDKGYDADRTWRAAARTLAGGNAQTTAALLTFFDTQHLAPTSRSQPWQEQAPCLKALLDRVREAIGNGDDLARHQALAELAQRADEITNAPDVIRSGTVDPGFAAQARPWLDAMQKWGRALKLTAAGLEAANQGSPAASRFFAGASQVAAEAAAIQTIAGVSRYDGPIKLADGVLDKFVADAPTLIGTNQLPVAGQTPERRGG